ncbi:MAG: M23 family metallopeptidase [Tannerella sp.]|jgi:murein DD-endopeptidase MepM/ murein hydrolase activator NlpD|nr:M23 family metallopeptidase [Tannerella sp.]
MKVRLMLCKPCALVGCILFVLFWSFSCRPDKKDVIPDNIIVDDTCNYLFDICIDSLILKEYKFKTGDNMSSVLIKLGFSAGKSDSIYRAASDLLDPKKLRAGLPYFTLSKQDSLQTIQYIIVTKSLIDLVVIKLTDNEIVVSPFQKEIVQKQQFVSGSVKSSLWNEMKSIGANPLLANEMSDVFAWQVNFFALQPKDSFRILYTESILDDSVSLNTFVIDGAIFLHEGKTFEAIPFMQDSIMEYFDDDGQSLRREFLKAPLEFSRISSRFTNSRFHPILRTYRAHHGVDYVAPAGTPVRTIGSGKIIGRGYEAGGGGNYLRIQHNSVYSTVYMHLRGFAQGMNVGRLLQQGDVIGYVGSTGLSTGAHLDFRVYKNGKPIDPLKMESPPAYPVRPELRDSFYVVKQQVYKRLLETDTIMNNE